MKNEKFEKIKPVSKKINQFQIENWTTTYIYFFTELGLMSDQVNVLINQTKKFVGHTNQSVT